LRVNLTKIQKLRHFMVLKCFLE